MYLYFKYLEPTILNQDLIACMFCLSMESAQNLMDSKLQFLSILAQARPSFYDDYDL